MNFFFRVDASIQIGNGHVLRCLTLAKNLRSRGQDCIFICRPHLGNLKAMIAEAGFEVVLLPAVASSIDEPFDPYQNWIGDSWENDIHQTIDLVKHRQVDWIVIDHYGIESKWEEVAKKVLLANLMVIDDLADNLHNCTLLLDQTFARNADEYIHLVPNNCELLLGSQFALLRDDFNRVRIDSIQRRKNFELRNILVSMGGVDGSNVTQRVLNALSNLKLELSVKVILGSNSPWINQVQKFIELKNPSMELLIDVKNMAELMLESDLIIGAAGTTSWERCCLGVPSIVIQLAENQRNILRVLSDHRAIISIKGVDIEDEIVKQVTLLKKNPKIADELSSNALDLVDGLGSNRVVDALLRVR